MNKHDIKVGTVLIAIDECKMDDDDEKTLTINKEYSILKLYEKHFVVTDDENDGHAFKYSRILNIGKSDKIKYFKVKETKEEKTETDVINAHKPDNIENTKTTLVPVIKLENMSLADLKIMESVFVERIRFLADSINKINDYDTWILKRTEYVNHPDHEKLQKIQIRIKEIIENAF